MTPSEEDLRVARGGCVACDGKGEFPVLPNYSELSSGRMEPCSLCARVAALIAKERAKGHEAGVTAVYEFIDDGDYVLDMHPEDEADAIGKLMTAIEKRWPKEPEAKAIREAPHAD